MLPNLFYINLKHRSERALLMQKNWNGIVNLRRVEAIDMSKEKKGVKGCFLSHQKAFEEGYRVAKHSSFIKDKMFILAEDDIIPCRDFNERLNLFFTKYLPTDWDVFMLGYSVNPSTGKFEKVNEYICRAKNHVLAGHCYVINYNFYEKYRQLLQNEKIHEYNFDAMLQYLQTHHNVYMAMPAMCYQYSSFSDNSLRVANNTQMTADYFKDVL